MNVAQQMLARAAAILAKQSPQAEIFRMGSEYVSCSCNRSPESDDPAGVSGASTEEGSVIWFPLNTRTVPERGTILIDSFNFQHRVKGVKHLGHQLELRCEVLRP